MILTCPSCGATHSAEGWENDLAAREAMAALVALPAPVAKGCLGYLGLFRPTRRALTWKKAKSITQDLATLVSPGWVQVQGKPARPCPPHIWAQAMEQMTGRTDLTRPLKNHNYLRQIAWQLADQADAGREQQQRQQVLSGEQRAGRQRGDDEPGTEFLRRYEAVHGKVEVPAAMQSLASKLAVKPGE
jgi:hypothetical protein